MTRDTNMHNLQFKITHRILACGYNLRIWEIKNSDICKYCNERADPIEHFVIFCEDTYKFWNYVLNWWTNNMKVIFRLDIYDILFGIPNDEKDSTINQFNFILMMAHYFRYKCKKTGASLDT